MKSNGDQNPIKTSRTIRALDFSEYKDQSKANLKEIRINDESSDREADFENDIGPSKNICVVIIKSDEEDLFKVYFRSICVSFLNLHLQGLHLR